jgi:RecA-family ATPase
MALIQLALAVATGRKWLDFFGVANPGKVLLALAEEDEEEIWRRVYQAARAMRLTDHQVELAARNIVALPLAGIVVNLIKHADGETVETAMMAALRKRLDTGDDWRLLILDPLSRFAGFDSEKDNAAATTFVATVESLLRVPGRPAILLAHHTHKASRQEGAQGGNAANARGASALIDGVRWAAELTPVSDGTVSFKVTKTNYSMGFEPVTLVRDADHGGYLRMQTAAEFTAVAQKLTDRRAKAVQTMRDLVLKTISERPGLRSGNDLYAVIQGNRPAVLAALRDLKQEGFLKSTPHGLKLTERSGLNE